jgi:hypothetical protein
MNSDQKRQLLRHSVLDDDNVDLAVAFGPTGPDSAKVTLLLDCEDSETRTMQQLSSRLSTGIEERLDVFRLADARPAAILMRQALEEGHVLKDASGTWGQLQSEREEIVAEAEAHERWKQDLDNGVSAVVEADDNVTLAVHSGPIRSESKDDRSDMNLLVGCKDESEETLLALYAELQTTGFKVEIMSLAKAREFPYALGHIVRTGRPLKDTEGQWEDLQSERDRIFEDALRQHREVQDLKRLYGGPGGTTSFN